MKRYYALEKVITLGGFSKAAQALGYSQSAISQMVASLENELSLHLVYRNHSTVRLTAEGEALFPAIERLVRQHRAVLEKAQEIRRAGPGVVRVASISTRWLTDLLKGMPLPNDDLRLVMHRGDYATLNDWLQSGLVDFAFVDSMLVQGMQTLALQQDRMLVLLPPDHPLARQNAILLQDLANEPFILLDQAHLDRFQGVGLEPKVKYVIHDDAAIMELVEAGRGISLLAELTLKRMKHNLVALPTNPPIYRTLAIAYKDANSLNTASHKFISLLQEYLNTKADGAGSI